MVAGGEESQEGLTLCRLRQNVLFFAGSAGRYWPVSALPRNDIGEGVSPGNRYTCAD